MIKKIDLYNRIKFDNEMSAFYIERCFVDRIHRYVLCKNDSMYWYVERVMNMPYRKIKKDHIVRCFYIIELRGSIIKIDKNV